MNTFIPIRRARTFARDFIDWWFGQLKATARSVLVRIAPRLLRHTTVVLRPHELVVESQNGLMNADPIHIPCGSGAWPADLGTPGVAESIRGERIAIGVDSSYVLVHQITLPKTLERELSRVIPLQLERDLPLRPESICTTWSVTRSSADPSALKVDVLVMHRRFVDRVLKLSESWGANLWRIGLHTDTGQIKGNFLSRRPIGRLPAISPVERRLAVVVAASALALLAFIGAQWVYERVQVGRVLQSLTPGAVMADKLAARVSAVTSTSKALATLMQQQDALDALALLTVLTPKESWVYQLQIESPPDRSPEAKLSAFAPVATLLVSTYRQSGQFAHVQLTSASSAGLGSGDRVDVSATWVTKGKPSGISRASLESSEIH